MTDPAYGISGSSSTAGTAGLAGLDSTTATPAGNGVGSLDKDAFLKLLVAQLKYQDPMKPSDPSQFMAQTAQFTMVERLDALSKAQTEATSWQRVVAGQGMIGRQVSGTTEQGADVSGLVTGVQVTAYGPVLELADGRTLPVDAVRSVTTAASPSTPTPTPATSPTPTPTPKPTPTPTPPDASASSGGTGPGTSV